ncbi:MAG: hydroxysqualene dehydroxylase HpnE [Candidatus Dormibacteria bacterium]
MRVAVVGAGLAGLSACQRLRRCGVQTVLVERSRLLGGRATSFTVDGVEVDSGQHVHLACCTEYIDFVAATGLGAALWTQPRFAVTVLGRDGRASRLRAASRWGGPLALVPSMLRYRPLGAPAALRVARALLDLDTPAPPAQTFAGWLERHHQRSREISAFWAPFVVPALNATPEEVDAASALFVLRRAFGDIHGARIGWSRVPLARIAAAAAGDAAEVRLRSPVESLLDDGRRVRGVRCRDGSLITADAVILAVPPRPLARLLGDPGAYGIAGLESFEPRAIVDVHLWFDVPRAGLDFAALLDSPVQWVFEKSPGHLCCSLSAADGYAGWPERELVELCRRELAAAWPRLRGARLRHGAATRDREATFIPRPGLRRPGWETTRPNLAIAGAWTDTGWPATMESAVRSGRAAAAGILAQLGATANLAGCAGA